MKFNVLDQSPIRRGLTPAGALAETVELAKHCESAGYYRYWVAEHHNHPTITGSSPELLMMKIGAETSKIRIGSGGVMLPNHAPLKVAENFRMLETFYPGRVDLGIGRASGSDMKAAVALRSGPTSYELSTYPQLVDSVRMFLKDAIGESGFPDGHPFKGVRAFPTGEGMPDMWLLGSSNESAGIAASLGLPYSFAHFINPHNTGKAVDYYRAHFKALRSSATPKVSIGVSAVVANTKQEAETLAAPIRLWLLRTLRGEMLPFPTTTEAESYNYNAHERAHLDAIIRSDLIGSPREVYGNLVKFAKHHAADELIILTITPDPEARIRSYELLAENFH